MNFKLLHRLGATLVFVISSLILLMTVAPTLSFWDCGEFITSAVTMAVPHPPGAPFFQLIGRIFSLVPVADLGFRVNLISTFSSALTVLFVYLITMRLLTTWKGVPSTTGGALAMILSAATGALILSFSDTFWFNASEAEVYGIGIFFIAVVVWIGIEWYTHTGVFDTERSLYLIAYLMGLSIGIHLLSLLALFFVFFLIYFRDRKPEQMNAKTLFIALALMGAGFAIIYPGIVKYIPQILSGSTGRYILILIVGGLIALVAAKKIRPSFRMIALSALLVTLGYSTYTLIIIRANQEPALNENAPATLEGLYSYLNREQYGTYPIMNGFNFDNRSGQINMNAKKFLPRRWNPESVQSYAKYSSDFEYFIKYQLGHIYVRYFLWNFIGRAGDAMDAPVTVISNEGDYSESQGYPNRYFAIPFILGLIGFFYHFRSDRRTWWATLALFFITGVGLVIYFNMAEPQVRERDYFFIGSFYVFAIWAGLGVYGVCRLWDMLRGKLGNRETAGIAIAGVLLVAGPGNMLFQNYQTHDRHYNYVAFDYAYNMLQSCDRDAILFTGGDNDTFPLWYLQYAAGIRRDVRIVNLSLVNTPWYARQLKNEQPYGAKTVSISYSDDELEQMRPIEWNSRQLSIPVDASSINLTALKDVPEVKAAPEVPRSIDFTVNSTYTDPEGRKGIRNQDIMVLDIVQHNINTRPVYFALSTAPSDRAGLDEHLIVEGLVARITPYKFPQRGDRYYPAINIPVTLRHLTRTRADADSNRAFGFMFRELANPRINLDEASTRMIMTFRYLYMGLAQVIYQDTGDKARAREVLAKMNATMPPAYHELDETLKTDLSTMYFLIDDKKEFNRYADELESYYLGLLDKDITGRQGGRNPYSVLLNIYEVRKQYQKGVDLMKRYQQVYPNDQSVAAQITSWERMAKGDTAAVRDTAAR